MKLKKYFVSQKYVLVCLQGYLKNVLVSQEKVLICLQGYLKNVILWTEFSIPLLERERSQLRLIVLHALHWNTALCLNCRMYRNY